ncbi:ATP-binding protein [Piscinibacter sp.]|uniref:ATP-binding protein n=1 Tax=Piscinibacter sp. TaxID=1903157 RepID=UPI002F4296BB
MIEPHPFAAPGAVHPGDDGAAARRCARVDQQVEDERVATVYALTSSPVLAGMAFSVLVSVILWPYRAGALVAGWLLVKLVLGAVRLRDVQRFTATPAAERRIAHWRRRSIALLAIDGVSWGVMGVVFMPEGAPGIHTVILASLVGIAGVGVFSYISLARGCVLFVVSVLLPCGVFQALRGTADGWFAALGLLIYLILMCLEANRGEARVIEMLRLRFENAWIADERHRAMLLAEHSSAAKSRFLATVSHEMRTPLNGIMGMTQLLQRGGASAEQLARLEVIGNSSRHLQAVIGDLLDLSRIEFGKLVLDKRPFELEVTVRDVTDLLHAVAQDRGLQFEVEFAPGLPGWVDGDASRIKQVLHNLIGNAIKFTARGEVGLHVEPCPAGLCFSVRDSGEGIAPQALERIFDAFEQGPAATVHARAGTGLGLTISRQIARAMGGDVFCRSGEGDGATFVFTLPLVSAAPPPPRGSEAAPASTARLDGHVLVVDDNPVNAVVASAMLECMGLRIDVADDGAQALSLMASRRYDLVLMDCQLPVMDGWEATRRWRSTEAPGRHLPIVALTALAVMGDRERCLQAGMDDYLAKPYEMDALAAVVRRQLEHSLMTGTG